MDWIGILSACGLTAAVGIGFVLWERYEDQRLARERFRRRTARRLPRRRSAAPNVDRWAA